MNRVARTTKVFEKCQNEICAHSKMWSVELKISRRFVPAVSWPSWRKNSNKIGPSNDWRGTPVTKPDNGTGIVSWANSTLNSTPQHPKHSWHLVLLWKTDMKYRVFVLNFYFVIFILNFGSNISFWLDKHRRLPCCRAHIHIVDIVIVLPAVCVQLFPIGSTVSYMVSKVIACIRLIGQKTHVRGSISFCSPVNKEWE